MSPPRSGRPGPRDDESALEVWSRLHHGLDPTTSGWITGWVRLTHAGARPFLRLGVGAGAVTALGLALSAAVPTISSAGGPWPLLACVVAVVAAVFDGIDGAVAGLTGTESPWGEVVDSTADRCSDLLLVLALVLLGAPVWVGVVLGASTLLLELVRLSARTVGMAGPGTITWWERPQRVIMAAFGTGLVGLEWCARRAGVDILPGVDGETLATTAAALGLAVSLVALAQLLRAVRSQVA